MKYSALIMSLLFNFLLVQESQAYIDPGSGSYVLQLVVAGFFAIVFTLKIFWRNIKSFLSGTIGRKHDHNQQ